jgi:hypothetical protein
MSIEDELTAEVMAILKDEDSKVAVMVAAKVLIACLHLATDRGHADAAVSMLHEAINIADMMKGGRTQ